MSSDIPEMPRDFGPRYIAWVMWCNAITILAVLQGAIGTVAALDDFTQPQDKWLIPPGALRWVLIANAILTGVVAQVKKNRPPGPPPTKTPPTIQPEGASPK